MSLIKNLPFEWLIGMRYIRVGKYNNNNFISFISLVSVIGIALSVAALIIVLSVMNGFQKELRDRMLSVVSHIEIFDVSGVMRDWQLLTNKIVVYNKEVIAAAPHIETQAIITHHNNVESAIRGVLVQGILPNKEITVSDVSRRMQQGKFVDLSSGKFNIILGSELARNLHVNLGNTVVLMTPQNDTAAITFVPRFKEFTVAGIFEIGHYEFDSSLAFIHLEDAKKAFFISGPSSLRLKIKNMFSAHEVASNLVKILGHNFYVRDWSQQYSNWFVAVKSEKRMMFIVLTLMITVAMFNVVSTLIITVNNKRHDIAILYTIGASSSNIMKIFLIYGVFIGLIGTTIGICVGIIISYNIDVIVPIIEQCFKIQFLPKNVYIISHLPSELMWSDVYIVGFITILLAFCATLYPSWVASSIKPAQVLRYE